MKIDKSISEKLNVIKLANEALEGLSISLRVPEDESRVTFHLPEEVPDADDTGTNDTIKPNTTVAISWDDDSEEHRATTLRYRRLNINLKKEKDKVKELDELGQLLNVTKVEDKALAFSNDEEFLTELKNQTISTLGLGTDSPLEVSEVSDDPMLEYKGLNKYKVTPDYSYLVNESITFNVKTRPVDYGYLKGGTAPEGEYRYFKLENGESLSTQVSNIGNFTGSVELILPYHATEVPNDFFHITNTQELKYTLNPLVNYPKLVTIGDNAFYLPNTSDSQVNIINGEVTTQEQANNNFFSKIEHIGTDAFKTSKITLTSSDVETTGLIKFGSENLTIDANGISHDNVEKMQYLSIGSLDAIFYFVVNSVNIPNSVWRKNYEVNNDKELITLRTNVVEEADYSEYGYAKYTSNGEDAFIFFTKDDVTSNSGVFSKFASIGYSNFKEVRLPDGLVLDYATDFLKGVQSISALNIASGSTLRAGAFKDTVIPILKFEDENFTIEEGAFENTTLTGINVKSVAAKEKVEAALTRINKAKSPTYFIEEEDPENPEEVTAHGFEHTEDA